MREDVRTSTNYVNYKVVALCLFEGDCVASGALVLRLWRHWHTHQFGQTNFKAYNRCLPSDQGTRYRMHSQMLNVSSEVLCCRN